MISYEYTNKITHLINNFLRINELFHDNNSFMKYGYTV